MGLLKGIHPLLTAPLLKALREMGHGDEIVIADCNFPAASVAASCIISLPIQLAGSDVVEALDAICSLLPLDFFAPIGGAVAHMIPVLGDSLPPQAVEVHAAGKVSSRHLREALAQSSMHAKCEEPSRQLPL